MIAPKDAIPILISAIAVVISVATYFTSLKPEHINLSVGDSMGVWHDQSGLNIYLPIVFQNTGAQAGVIRSIGLIIVDPKTKESIFIKWVGFVKPDETSGEKWITESSATPLSVPAASESTRMTQFYASGSLAEWLPKPIEYELYLLAWTSDSKTATIKYPVRWAFSENDVLSVKLNFENVKKGGNDQCTWVTGPKYGPDSKKLSQSEFDELVKVK